MERVRREGAGDVQVDTYWIEINPRHDKQTRLASTHSTRNDHTSIKVHICATISNGLGVSPAYDDENVHVSIRARAPGGGGA